MISLTVLFPLREGVIGETVGVPYPKIKYKTGEAISTISDINIITVVTVSTMSAKHHITIAKYLMPRSIIL